MKKLVYASVFLALLTTACKKSSSGSSAAVSANLSGKTFSSAQSQAFYSQSQGLFAMVGYTIGNGDTTVLELDLSSNVTLGSAVSFTSGQTVYYYDTKGNISYTGDQTTGHGTVTINGWDKNNTKVTGTFTGVLLSDFNPNDSLVVTNGQFNVTYIAEP
ncbi:MAG TPA: hypothetical protein VL547_03965 [Dinghuibacter sp.]|uniref:hypothetical protein n=1 Tax=Dinghuibacter sp. TaxID=2024697 RepID=UPI002BBFE3DE|nr:hypothetical protein [Dinghuibacter sp.]HTJ11148.1 hypothetical protein [Dinghuibacter sp.]